VTLDEGGHRAHPLPEDQIAFPVAGHGPIVGLGGPFADVDGPAKLALVVHH
jgi:hypothetical protein